MLLWVEQLQSQGRYTFTRAQVESDTGRSFVAAQTALRRLREQGRIVAPRRGFYVVVPPEYRAAGSPPASWFIDDLMRHLGVRYYLGALTAAAYHGATHQRAMRMGPGAPSASRKRSASSSSPLASSHLAAMSSRKASCKSSR